MRGEDKEKVPQREWGASQYAMNMVETKRRNQGKISLQKHGACSKKGKRSKSTRGRDRDTNLV